MTKKHFEKLKKMNRENFDPTLVLSILGDLRTGTHATLLQEACHALARQQVQIDAIKRKAAELHAITIKQ